jgi:leader peptidase (prepilin peptidase)/N-methyltransferase
MLNVPDPFVLGAVGAAIVLAALAARRDLALPLRLALPGLVVVISALGTVLLSSGAQWHAALGFSTLIVICALIAEIDRRIWIIPDPLVGALLVLALVAPLSTTWAARLLGAALLALLFLGVRAAFELAGRGEALGLGDVKLAAAIGALLGPQDALIAVAIAGGATMSVMAPAALRAPAALTTRVPFGIGLSAGLAALAAMRLWTLI